MRIATWNVNGLRARIDYVKHWLLAREPDVVGLQELKLTDEDFPHEVFNELGYTAETFGQKAWNGVAVLSRVPITVIERDLPGQSDMGARLIRAHCEGADGQGVDFTTVYCPNGKSVDHADYPRKLAWFDALNDYVAGLDTGAATILCGDFNIVPKPIDCWRGEAADETIFCTTEERERFHALIDQGLIDLYREVYPDEQAFSWWDYRGGAFHRGMGLRIDMLLGTKSVRERLSHAEIDRDYRKKKEDLKASDHAPVYIDLKD